MKPGLVLVPVVFIGLLAAPLLFRTERAPDRSEGRRVIILTPHNEQIRTEFERAFETWHQQHFGESVDVVWSVPGGTSDIRRMLEAQYTADLRAARPVGGSADLLFGGGEFEHDVLKRGVEVTVDGETRHTSISTPVDFDPAWLKDVYGPNDIAGNRLYDPDHYWFGTALSSFGIIYNRDVLRRLEVAPPQRWRDLGAPRLLGWVAAGNPSQSASIRKSFETILQREGWPEGWRVLRRLAANSRYFSASSSTVPIDVSRGDAAAGICIDFYGRFQTQAVADAGNPERLGYIDPPGETAIDADPISMLRGAPNPVYARRFIEFTLTENAQALWQFRKGARVDHLHGPHEFELRRLPVLRSMYEKYGEHFVDRVNPFEFARAAERVNPDYWSFVALIFNAMAIDNHAELAAAWKAIVTHPAYPADGELVRADEVSDPTLRRMLELFDSMPSVAGPGGAIYSLDDDRFLSNVRRGWLDGGWSSEQLWPREAQPGDVLRVQFAAFFRASYRETLRLAAEQRRITR